MTSEPSPCSGRLGSWELVLEGDVVAHGNGELLLPQLQAQHMKHVLAHV